MSDTDNIKDYKSLRKGKEGLKEEKGFDVESEMGGKILNIF